VLNVLPQQGDGSHARFPESRFMCCQPVTAHMPKDACVRTVCKCSKCRGGKIKSSSCQFSFTVACSALSPLYLRVFYYHFITSFMAVRNTAISVRVCTLYVSLCVRISQKNPTSMSLYCYMRLRVTWSSCNNSAVSCWSQPIFHSVNQCVHQ